jgi:type II restriction/modification system DNA methylase subunit YeeA
MNRTKLKNYAPQARKDFIEAVTAKAAQYGLTAAKIEPMTEKGDVVLIAGKPFPKAIGDKRKRLEDRIKRNGFEQTMEAMAYTWFNRLVAIRYMELHGYLEHGFRVLSSRPKGDGSGQQSDAISADRPLPTANSTPEILEKAQYVDLSGLDQKKVVELKLDGTKEEELYRLLLTAQFNALSKAMPFLFEKIDDETELLLPDSLLNSDSLIRKLVSEIDEEDWKEVEIIGWLYQFYISDKKDEVIGKVVKSEDIPAATQLFTPSWIVKYLVQNTLGRQWLATYPQSALRQQMEYYIEPAEQTPEVQEQLKAITPTSLNPEELTLLDPACGSGHILVEAYGLFKAIYQERGYRAKDIPALILQKNLFGMEIDDRAAQLAAFALMMKARADDRNLFSPRPASGRGAGGEGPIQPNILAFENSQGMNASEIYFALTSPLKEEKEDERESSAPDGHLFEIDDNLFTRAEAAKAEASRTPTTVNFTQGDIAALLELFENAKTFGSLIQVPPKLAAKLPEIEKRLDDVLKLGNLTHASAHVLRPLLQQAKRLTTQYDAVVANPPYMGGKYYSPRLKEFVNREYQQAKADLYSCFIQRNGDFARPNGFVGMITIPNWMFLSTFEDMRVRLLQGRIVDTFIHNGRGAFGSDFGSCSFVFRTSKLPSYFATYRRLFDKQGSVAKNEELQSRFGTSTSYFATVEDLSAVPGSPLAYWIGGQTRKAFRKGAKLGDIFTPRKGIDTGNNLQFLRFWYEVNSKQIGYGCKSEEDSRLSAKKWFPYNKGGPFRKWFGNLEYVVNWQSSGRLIRNYKDENGKSRSNLRNQSYFFRPGITWTDVSISSFGARQLPEGCICDNAGSACYGDESLAPQILAFFTTSAAFEFLRILNPSLHFQAGNLSDLPILDFDEPTKATISLISKDAVEIAKQDWNECETAWGFEEFIPEAIRRSSVEHFQETVDDSRSQRFRKMKFLEEQNNRIFIEAYGLQEELSPEVSDDQITLYRPNREEDIKRLLSYAIGCVMGRYSLDKPGLIYAHSGNEGFDASQYKTFRADDDGIIPLLETDWGIRDDATNRFVEFIGVAWPKEHLEENLKFVADSLGPTASEQPQETIRRYLSTGFYKHHLSMYKKRPIYWLFSSGKQRAFQCLVYLHRYNEGTLARMRTEYVIPLMGKLTARLEHLQGPPEQKGAGGEIAATNAVTVKRKLEKERDNIKKQLAELQTFDAKLRHYADLRIKLDLDDGVKVNYGKFGELLAESKAICGTKEDD